MYRLHVALWALLLLVADRGGFRKPRPGTQGWVIDAGANDGESTVMLADALRPLSLNVLAVEPLANNVQSVRAKTEHMNNVEVLLAGLGEINGSTVHYPKHFDFRPAGGDAQVSAFRRLT